MATPKINAIIAEFSSRINDPVSIANPDSNTVSLTDKMAYINKAMYQLFNDAWTSVAGDKAKFIQLFPELLKIVTVALANGASYTIATPNFDYFALHSGSMDGNYVAVVPIRTYDLLKTGKYKFLSAKKPIMVEVNRTIYVFPTGIGNALEMLVIKQPLNPTDGSFLTKDGDYDSPFSPQWNSKIAEIAEKFYKIDAGVM